jgi:hypothetical protein
LRKGTLNQEFELVSLAAYLTQVPGTSGERSKKKQQSDVELSLNPARIPRVD